MGKARAGHTVFPRVPKDFYPTPPETTGLLVPHLPPGAAVSEPCAGGGAICDALHAAGFRIVFAIDKEPSDPRVAAMDCLQLTAAMVQNVDVFVTNPPWPRARASRGEPTLTILKHLAALRPTWLMLSADFCHNNYAHEVMQYCRLIVPAGRVRWFGAGGLENSCWYLFDAAHPGPTVFAPPPRAYPRTPAPRASATTAQAVPSRDAALETAPA